MDKDELRGFISKKFKTQKRFADAIGWHENKVTLLLTGKFKPDTDQVEKISRVLDLTLAEHGKIFLPWLPPNGGIST